jgi:hypothetical protein
MLKVETANATPSRRQITPNGLRNWVSVEHEGQPADREDHYWSMPREVR